MKREQAIILLVALFVGGYMLGRATARKADAGAAVAPVAVAAGSPSADSGTPASPSPASATSGPTSSEPPTPAPTPAPAAAPSAPSDPNQIWRVTTHADDAKVGPDTAPVRVVVFGAFGNMESSEFAPAIHQAAKEFGNKVQIRFKHKVIPAPHPDAVMAAEASAAANAQGNFWPFFDKLMPNTAIDRGGIEAAAKAAGLDMARFTKELDGGKYRGQVLRDSLLTNEVAAHSYPNILVNGVRLKTKTFEGLKALIEDQARKQASAGAGGKKYEDIVKEGKTFEQMGGPAAKFDIDGSPILGRKEAKIEVAVFEDFQCPFCSKIAPSMKDFQKRFPNDVKIVYKHMPLDIHAEAQIAAQASMAAMVQGKFWEYHDILYNNQQALTRPDLEKYAEQAGLDVAKFKKDLDSGVGKGVISRDMREGQNAGASGTPSVFINGMKYQGPRGYPPEGLEAVARVHFGL